MAKKSKKKVLALPIEDEGAEKVLLLEPEDEVQTGSAPETPDPTPEPDEAPIQASEPDEASDETPSEGLRSKLPSGLTDRDDGSPDEDPSDADETEAEPDEDEGGLSFSLPFGGSDEDETGTSEGPDADEDAQAEPSEADEDEEDADEGGGFGFSLPFGGSDDEDEEAPDAPEAPDADEDADEDADAGGGFGLSLPFGGSDAEDDADDEADAAPAEAEPETTVADADAVETPASPDREALDLADASLDLETIGEAGTGLSEVDVAGDTPKRVALDPIPYRASHPDAPTPDAGETGTADVEPATGSGTATDTEAGSIRRLDRRDVERIRYNVDVAIYRAARDRQGRPVEDPDRAVDELLETARSPEAADAGTEEAGGLPDAETRIDEVAGLPEDAADRLAEVDVRTITDLVEADAVTLAIETGLRIGDVRNWQRRAELMHVPDLKGRHAEILTEVGINRIDLLADQDPDDLQKRVVQYLKYREHEPGADVSGSATREWVQAARRLRPPA